jgi:hypothetical protein
MVGERSRPRSRYPSSDARRPPSVHGALIILKSPPCGLRRTWGFHTRAGSIERARQVHSSVLERLGDGLCLVPSSPPPSIGCPDARTTATEQSASPCRLWRGGTGAHVLRHRSVLSDCARVARRRSTAASLYDGRVASAGAHHRRRRREHAAIQRKTTPRPAGRPDGDHVVPF